MTRSLFIYVPYEVQTHTIIAMRAEGANSRKLSHTTDGCGTPIGLAVSHFWQQRRRWRLAAYIQLLRRNTVPHTVML